MTKTVQQRSLRVAYGTLKKVFSTLGKVMTKNPEVPGVAWRVARGVIWSAVPAS
jgi:hypothetical protein